MKKSNILLLGLKNFIIDKKKYINIFLLTIGLTLIVISVSFNFSIKKYWENTIKSFVDFRTYYVRYDTDKYTETEAINRLKQLPHVLDVGSSSSYLITMVANDYKNNADGTIYLEGTAEGGIKTVLGKNISKNDGDKNKIICAKQFYPQIEINMSDYDIKKSVDLTDKVGEKISLSFLGKKEVSEEFELIGLYDARDNYTEGNVCYGNFDLIKKLNMKYQKESFSYNDTEYPLIMVLDDVDNAVQLKREASNNGFNFSEAMMRIDKKRGKEILNITSISAIIILILTLIINFGLYYKNYKDNKSYNALLKSYGYSNFSLISIQYISHLIMGFVAFAFSIPISLIVIQFIKNIYFSSKIMYINMNFTISLFSIIVALIVCIIIPLIICIILLRTIKKANIIDEIK